MSVIAVSGRKGGIGKTTLTANIAAELVAMRRRVVALDADPQKSLCSWAGLGTGLLTGCVEAIDTTHPGRFRSQVEAARAKADRVLIDCPPGFADPALLAALVADLVLLPCGPSPLDLMAVREALDVTREAMGQRNDGKPLVRLVPARMLPHTNLGKDLTGALGGLGEKVLPGVSQRVAVAEAALTGLTLREHAPGSPAHVEFQALVRAIERTLR